VEIPGTPAGRQRCPWHTPKVTPTTLAPKTGEVSWVSRGFGGFYSSSKSAHFCRSPRILRPARKLSILRSSLAECHRPSRDVPAPGPIQEPNSRWCPAPRDLLPRGLDQGATCPCAAASRPIGSGPTIFCGDHGGCPLLTQSWRVTEGAVASSSWVRCATDPPSLF
jgi:hypothetical protein